MIATLFVFLLSLSAHASGTLDHSATAAARTSPVGASVEGTAGYLVPVYGEPSENNLFWGYVRPYATVKGFNPALRTGLDIYPVSFFGLSGGRTFSAQFVDQPGLDCEGNECELEINSWYWQARLLGQYKKLGMILVYEKTDYDDHDHLHKLIGDGNNVVLLSPIDEEGELRSLTLNYQFIKELGFGLKAQDFKTEQTENRQRSQVLYANYSHQKRTYTFAAGRTESTPCGVSAQIIFAVTWTGAKKAAP